MHCGSSFTKRMYLKDHCMIPCDFHHYFAVIVCQKHAVCVCVCMWACLSVYFRVDRCAADR